jgi:hypothetical protein
MKIRQKDPFVEAWVYEPEKVAKGDVPEWFKEAQDAWPGPGGLRVSTAPSVELVQPDGPALTAQPDDVILRSEKGVLHIMWRPLFDAEYETDDPGLVPEPVPEEEAPEEEETPEEE